MADPTSLNGQITDAVTQVSLGVLGNSPSQALALNMQSGALTAALGVQSALANQQQLATLAIGTTAQAINQVYCRDTAASGRADAQVLCGQDVLAAMVQLTAIVKSMKQNLRASYRRREPRCPGQTPVADDFELYST